MPGQITELNIGPLNAIAGPLTRSLDTMNQTVRLMAVVEHILNDHFSDPGIEKSVGCVSVSVNL